MTSGASALDPATGELLALPPAEPVDPAGPLRAQLWRTVPMRPRPRGPFRGGEFTIPSGVANALAPARELVLIFDQYFWSRPMARFLNAQLHERPGLRAIVLLPPWSDMEPSLAATREDYARRLGLEDASDGMYRENDPEAQGAPDRIAVYGLWHPVELRGICLHAKFQLHDDELLVIGTANLCRRSFLCDTEAAAAVHDGAPLRAHRARLSRCLFPSSHPDHASRCDLRAPCDGARFFEAFRRAALAPGAFVTPDPWRSFTPRLPSGAERHQHPLLFQRSMYDRVVDPSSLPLKVETARCPHLEAPGAAMRPGRRDAVAHLVQGCPEAEAPRTRPDARSSHLPRPSRRGALTALGSTSPPSPPSKPRPPRGQPERSGGPS